jgi:hypothetical protein
MMQVNKDLEHFRVLCIFHYVVVSMLALFACIPAIHVVLGILMRASPSSLGPGPQRSLSGMGAFFIAIGGGIILIGWLFATLVL